MRLKLHFLEMPVLLHGVPQSLPVRAGTAENLQLAAAVIVKPFDAPLTGRLAILENHGWLRHRLTSCGGASRKPTSLAFRPRRPPVVAERLIWIKWAWSSNSLTLSPYRTRTVWWHPSHRKPRIV